MLPALGDALLVLILCFNHRRVYTWMRQAPGGGPHEVEITSEYPLVFRATRRRRRHVDAAGQATQEVGDPERESVAEHDRSVALPAERALPSAKRQRSGSDGGLELDPDVAAVAPAAERAHLTSVGLPATPGKRATPRDRD